MSACLVRAPAKESFEYPCEILGCDPAAAILDFQLDVIGERALGNAHFTRESKLERVGNEIQDNLFPLVPIHIHRFGQAGRIRS